jgi:hypothetical protein
MCFKAWAGVTAAAGVKAGVRAKGEAPDRVAAGSLDILTNQPINLSMTIEGGDLMPGFDRTGPMGAGAVTGGARGRCNPATAGNIPAYAGGCGHGRGLGLRRGFRGGYGPGKGYGSQISRVHRQGWQKNSCFFLPPMARRPARITPSTPWTTPSPWPPKQTSLGHTAVRVG